MKDYEKFEALVRSNDQRGKEIIAMWTDIFETQQTYYHTDIMKLLNHVETRTREGFDFYDLSGFECSSTWEHIAELLPKGMLICEPYTKLGKKYPKMVIWGRMLETHLIDTWNNTKPKQSIYNNAVQAWYYMGIEGEADVMWMTHIFNHYNAANKQLVEHGYDILFTDEKLSDMTDDLELAKAKATDRLEQFLQNRRKEYEEIEEVATNTFDKIKKYFNKK